MTSDFKKYSSIENDRAATVEHFRLKPETQGKKFYVAEKIHGSNLQLKVDKEGEIQVGSRNHYLTPGKSFMGWQTIEQETEGIILRHWGEHFSGEEIIYFGEIYGGYYPNSPYPVPPGTKKVQKGVSYFSGNHFRIFDIYKVEEETYMGGSFLYETFRPVDLAPLLHVGSFKECCAQPNDFLTKIPEQFALENFEGNVAEGWVLKGWHEDVRVKKGDQRVILKSKNDKFKEKASEGKERVPIPDHPRLAEIAVFICDNRWDNLVSKEGEPVSMNQFGMFLGKFSQDVLKEAVSEGILPEDWKAQDEHRWVGKQTTKLCQKFVMDKFNQSVV